MAHYTKFPLCPVPPTPPATRPSSPAPSSRRSSVSTATTSASASSSSSSTRSVHFHPHPSVSFTHPSHAYDRTPLPSHPVSQKDVAALLLYRMSLPGFIPLSHHDAKRARRRSVELANREMTVWRDTHSDLTTTDATTDSCPSSPFSSSSLVSAEDQEIFTQQPTPATSPEDWITSLAHATRTTSPYLSTTTPFPSSPVSHSYNTTYTHPFASTLSQACSSLDESVWKRVFERVDVCCGLVASV